MISKKYTTVDEYLSYQPGNAKARLKQLRTTIQQAAPGAQEVISYNMPAIRQHGILVYYAAAKAHIGFYPTPAAIIAFKDELSAYQTSKGAIQFPIDKAIPKALVKKIVKFRVAEDLEKAALKKSK